MFDKILIANRGEIACRVIKTAKRMGIATVAVYSDADSQSLHVQLADKAVHIGAPPASESYLRADRIVAACRETGAQAVHPGYGFLSENGAFRDALDDAGIVFIGPGQHAIDVMGDKIRSKRLAEEASVNVIPGYTDVIRDADHAVSIAREIGYPVMLKASAGGGGKGMRVVWNDEECADGFTRAANEAQSSFGDDRVFAEKFIEEPRHIEIQVLADAHGNVVYLGERECSIQRRHQKVVEEAPSPFLDEATRTAMGEQAVALARAVDYQSAGTVEFIVDANRNFYFLEMNTRLQVEHPVTELVTGLDLVEQMIRVANGEPLRISQADVKLNGWALETRVYAEDPLRNFLPSIGRLSAYQPPQETETVRVDTGIVEGSEVSMFYDPMIAKLITYGPDRTTAIDRMANALDAYYIKGVSNNIAFLNAIVTHPRFIEGRLTTNFIDEEYPDGFNASDVPQGDPLMLAALAAYVHERYERRRGEISGQFERLKVDEGPNRWTAISGANRFTFAISARSASAMTLETDSRSLTIDSQWRLGDAVVFAYVDGQEVCAQCERTAGGYRLTSKGSSVDILMLRPDTASLVEHMIEREPPDLSKFLLSPMPGLLIRLAVSEGDEVKAGEELAVVEAMKMENSLRAAADGVVAKVLAEEGASLMVDAPILEFE